MWAFWRCANTGPGAVLGGSGGAPPPPLRRSPSRCPLLAQRLMATFARDAATAVGIFTMGDLVAQQIEHGSTETVAPFSADRTASASALGLIWGGGISPMAYRNVERLYPGRHPLQVVKKIALSTAILGCVGNWVLIFSKRMLACERRSSSGGQRIASVPLTERVQATARSVNADWTEVMSYDLRIWPPTDLVVYSVMPLNLRVAFVSTVSICWQSYLSYAASRGTGTATVTPQAASCSAPALRRRKSISSSRPEPQIRDG